MRAVAPSEELPATDCVRLGSRFWVRNSWRFAKRTEASAFDAFCPHRGAQIFLAAMKRGGLRLSIFNRLEST